MISVYDSQIAQGTTTGSSILSRIGNVGYTGVILYPPYIDESEELLRSPMTKFVHTDALQGSVQDLAKSRKDVVIASSNLELLNDLKTAGISTCFRARVEDAKSLEASIEFGKRHNFLMVSFQDPTNIPLELIIATLQPTDTVLLKEIVDPTNVDDAIVSLGVMEVGADGVVFSPQEHAVLDSFLTRLEKLEGTVLPLQEAVITESRPVGMGFRSCIDLSTLFSPTEGMLVGSTSHGGILCCPEVFYLPYMDLRPFRVNAGAVHSYVYNFADKTNYMTELKAGSPVMIVDHSGKRRKGVVGRMKTEVRPLRLIEAQFGSGERVNVLLQDDWHVRIYSGDGKPFNITELRPGDRVMGYAASPGRHVGIKVTENILEN